MVQDPLYPLHLLVGDVFDSSRLFVFEFLGSDHSLSLFL